MKTLLLFPLILMAGTTLTAQKLPNKQESSLRAPDNIKIDGKATEWNDKFQAYNTTTDVFYTIANDDNNLYLCVKANDETVINKLYRSGLTLVINTTGKKTDKNAAMVIFPVWDKENDFHTNTGIKPQIVPGDTLSVAKADSFMREVNKKMISKEKWIRTAGMPHIDSLISLYNEDGIKAAALFDNKMVYTLELCIALKNIGIRGIENAPVLNYHITLNALIGPIDNRTVTYTIGPDGNTIMHVQRTGTPRHIGNPADDMKYMNLTAITDFWGEYTLAKKP